MVTVRINIEEPFCKLHSAPPSMGQLLTMRLRFILSAIQTVLENYCFVTNLLKPINVVSTTEAIIQLDIR